MVKQEIHMEQMLPQVELVKKRDARIALAAVKVNEVQAIRVAMTKILNISSREKLSRMLECEKDRIEL